MRPKSIPFNIPFVGGNEQHFLEEVFKKQAFCGDGFYTQSCEKQLQDFTGTQKVLLTSSCTHALEMCALLLDIQTGDEVIMPSFNFVSAANAFVLRGAKIIFVDIDPNTMNIAPDQITSAISDKTKAILVVHYGGVACDMDVIMNIAGQHQIAVIEDAAHAIGAFHNEKHLGTIGDFGTLSFHDTKNIHCGEGGALLINNPKYIERATVLREKGTNRAAFLNGKIDKYTWVDLGSSYLMSELSAGFLFAQLQKLDEVTKKRLELWRFYQKELSILEVEGKLSLAKLPSFSVGNGHVFYLKCKTENERDLMISYLDSRNIKAYFHYVPLHSSRAGQIFGCFYGKDTFTSKGSDCLLRLPLYFDMDLKTVIKITDSIKEFYNGIS